MYVEEAKAILAEKFPDKKIYGIPAEYKGQFSIAMVSKDYAEGTPNYDSAVCNVDPRTGKIEKVSAFDLDVLRETKPQTKEELQQGLFLSDGK